MFGLVTSVSNSKLIDDLFFAVAVVVDLDLVQDVVAELVEVRAAGRALERDVVGDNRHRIGLGTATGEGITATALVLARLMAQQQDTKVVLVDLAGSSSAIADFSADRNAPGLAELMNGEASFSQIITKDRLSRLHLVAAGRPGCDRTLLTSPRLVLAIDALLRVYDRVLLDAGSASDLPAELLTASARAVVVPDAAMEPDARKQMCVELKAAGFSDVTMLSKACLPSEMTATAPARGRGVAYSELDAAILRGRSVPGGISPGPKLAARSRLLWLISHGIAGVLGRGTERTCAAYARACGATRLHGRVAAAMGGLSAIGYAVVIRSAPVPSWRRAQLQIMPQRAQ